MHNSAPDKGKWSRLVSLVRAVCLCRIARDRLLWQDAEGSRLSAILDMRNRYECLEDFGFCFPKELRILPVNQKHGWRWWITVSFQYVSIVSSVFLVPSLHVGWTSCNFAHFRNDQILAARRSQFQGLAAKLPTWTPWPDACWQSDEVTCACRFVDDLSMMMNDNEW